MNSFPFADADVTPNPVSHLLGLWKVTDGANVGQGHPDKATLSGTIIHSKTYAFPVPVLSTGTGTVDSNGITSEKIELAIKLGAFLRVFHCCTSAQGVR